MKHINLVKHFGGIKMNITGLVTEIYEGEIQKGKSKGQPFFTISLDNDDKLYLYTKENYSWIENVAEGKTYDFEVTRLRNYLTISGLAKEIAPGTSGASNEGSRVSPAPMTERFYKNRISALSSAVEFLAGDATAKDEEIMNLADLFFNWIQGTESD